MNRLISRSLHYFKKKPPKKEPTTNFSSKLSKLNISKAHSANNKAEFEAHMTDNHNYDKIIHSTRLVSKQLKYS